MTESRRDAEREAVARAMWDVLPYTASDDLAKRLADAAIAALDAERARPPQGEDHEADEREGKPWVCMACGFVGDRQSCGNCGAESRPVPASPQGEDHDRCPECGVAPARPFTTSTVRGRARTTRRTAENG